MKKYLILLFTVLTSLHVSAQSDGSQLWLGKQYANSCQVISQLPNDATAKIAKQELENNWRGKNVELKIDKSLNLGEGYNIYARPAQQGDNIQYEATITASNPIGLLYGAYELIRLQNTDAYNTGSGNQQNFSKAIDETEKPQVGLRILNHWDKHLQMGRNQTRKERQRRQHQQESARPPHHLCPRQRLFGHQRQRAQQCECIAKDDDCRIY